MASVSIGAIAQAIGAPEAAKDWQKHIARWADMYACKDVEKSINLQDGEHKRRMRTMSMFKRVCEDWAGLCWTENAAIEVADVAGQMLIDELLGERFSPQFADHIERVMAKGIGALELIVDGLLADAAGNIVQSPTASLDIDYIEAENIIPLAWRRGEITAVAFVSFPERGRIDVREHRSVPGGQRIQNRSFAVKSGKLTEIPEERLIEEGVAPDIFISSPYPLFRCFSPASSNNIDPFSPYGISVCANAVDQLTALDLVFDNFGEDFELGGKMVGIPDSMLRRDAQGNIIPPQREKKNLFVSLASDVGVGGGADEIWEHNPELRVADNKLGIDTALSMVSSAVGMGAERYVYRAGTVATATQVISENSDLFRNRRKHMQVINSTLIAMARAALWCGAEMLGMPIDPAAELIVRSDDSVIEDDSSRIARGLSLLQGGAISQYTFLVDYLGMTEADALVEVERSVVKVPELF